MPIPPDDDPVYGAWGESDDPSDSTIVTQHKTPVTADSAWSSDRLSLLVICDQVIATQPLPASGAVTIGRAPGADVTINDPSISRAHATLTLGSELSIEDLGSSNGTRVGDRTIPASEAVEIAPGDVVQLGNVTLIVQTRPPPVRTVRIWPHDYFEARLEEECARAHRTGSRFAVGRLHCEPAPGPELFQKVLVASGRASDVAGEYGPGELELLFVGLESPDARVGVARVAAELEREGVRVRTGLSCYPRDGRNPYELVRRASPFPSRPAGDTEAAVSGAIEAGRRMQDLYRLAERIAAGNITVLILGETGVGKEVLAERVHKTSPRAEKPYLKLNCAALSETLLESELFGHVRGAFTGAVEAKAGLLETAEGGTVFLDEVGELPLSTQVKLLRVIEERKVLRVGGLEPRRLDVRFIAATNRDLEDEIARGTFRQDLFFRLNGATLVIPPLRQRTSEIPGLAEAFVAHAARELGLGDAPPITPEAMDLLLSYGWPGNIRELRNVMERSVLLCGEGPIAIDHLPLEKMRATVTAAPAARSAPADAPHPAPAPSPVAPPTNRAATAPLADPEAEERQRILDALAACGGNQTAAARMLGIARRTLINKLDRYHISGPRKKR